MKKDKKEIERLKKELHDANTAIIDLQTIRFRLEDAAKQLRSDLRDKDEKYAALLERYISTMEKAIKLPEQTVVNTPDSQVMRILGDIRALIAKWFYENAYDYQLDKGIEAIENKYLGGEKNE